MRAFALARRAGVGTGSRRRRVLANLLLPEVELFTRLGRIPHTLGKFFGDLKAPLRRRRRRRRARGERLRCNERRCAVHAQSFHGVCEIGYGCRRHGGFVDLWDRLEIGDDVLWYVEEGLLDIEGIEEGGLVIVSTEERTEGEKIVVPLDAKRLVIFGIGREVGERQRIEERGLIGGTHAM